MVRARKLNPQLRQGHRHNKELRNLNPWNRHGHLYGAVKEFICSDQKGTQKWWCQEIKNLNLPDLQPLKHGSRKTTTEYHSYKNNKHGG